MFSLKKFSRLNRCSYYFTFILSVSALTLTIWFATGCSPRWQITPLEPAPLPVTADSGMVVAAHPLAAEAGVLILRDGGNAIDAALATLFMLNVVEPHASGLGGGGFALVRTADGDSKVVVYRERAPRAVEPSFYEDPSDSLHERMKTGATSVCVPGAASGWAELYDRWCSLPLERLAMDAVRTAEEGFPVDPTLAGQIANHFEMLSADSLLAKTFLKTLDVPLDSSNTSDSLQQLVYLPYEVGDTLRQPELARTLRMLVEKGLRSFYRWPIAEAVVGAVQAGGGTMSLDDLEFYHAEVTEPVNGEYAGYEILTVPPPSRGGVALIETLNLFKQTGATEWGLDDKNYPQSVHLMSQCIQQAYADARFKVSDPAFIKTDWQKLLTKEHTLKASEGISIEAKAGIRFALQETERKDHGNTTHLVVVDRWGNIVSLTQSINSFFGAGVMAGKTGLLLNNLMADFNLPPTKPSPILPDTLNYIQARKRPRSNMTPLIMLKDGKPVLVIGTPGASRIVAALSQIVVNMVDYKLDVSAAIDYPRFFPIMQHNVLENRVNIFMVMENRVNRKLLKYLKKSDYKIYLTGSYSTYFGGAHGIMLPPLSEKLSGAADKRRGGAARGY